MNHINLLHATVKCYDCQAPSVLGRKWCAACLEKRAKATAKWRKTHPQQTKESKRRSYEKRVGEGKCVDCVSPALDGQTKCLECCHKAAARHINNRERDLHASAAWRAAHPGYMRERDLWGKYGLTSKTFDVLFIEQDSCCDICSAVEPGGKGYWHVDHKHVEGIKKLPPEEKRRLVRGILCHNCNLMLGHARDNPDILVRGAGYLKRS